MALFGRRSARQRLRSAARESLAIPAFSAPVDCSAWVLGGLWPAELATITPETAPLADYLNADLLRIANSANERLHAIGRSGLVGPARQSAEARIINVARAFAVLRVESTVRNLHGQRTGAARGRLPEAVAGEPAVEQPPPPEPAPPTPAAPAVNESNDQRLQRLLDFVARQEPGLRWAIGVLADGRTLLTTDLANGWIPPGIDLPAGVHLLEPGRRTGTATAMLGTPTESASYSPGDRLGRARDFGATDVSVQPRELAPIDDLGWQLSEATHWRDGLPRMANTLAKAGSAGTGVGDAEIDLLRVHLDTMRCQLSAQYPDIDTALVLNCMLLAATEGIATGDTVSANYHYSWFRTLSASQTGQWDPQT